MLDLRNGTIDAPTLGSYAESAAPINPTADPQITAELWFYARSGSLPDDSDPSGGTGVFLISQPSGNPSAGGFDPTARTLSLTVSLFDIAGEINGEVIQARPGGSLESQWHHIALVFDGTLPTGTNRGRLILDGIVIATSDFAVSGGTGLAAAPAGTSGLAVGANRVNATTMERYFSGRIDQLRIWNTARSTDLIRENIHRRQNTPASFIALYQMDVSSSPVPDEGTAGGGGSLTLYGAARLIRSAIPFSTAQPSASPGTDNGAIPTQQNGVETNNHTVSTLQSFLDPGVRFDDRSANGRDPLDATVRFVFARIDSMPPVPPAGATVQKVADRYYVVDCYIPGNDANYGSPGSFTAFVTFVVPDLTVSPSDPKYFGASAAGLRLYRRSTAYLDGLGTNGVTPLVGGGWTNIATATSVTSDGREATFPITSAGTSLPVLRNQLIVVRASGDAALPVTLDQFGARSVDAGVELSWRTQTESDNQGFVIYRAEGNGDEQQLVTFLDTEALSGQGTTAQPTSYSYVDRTARVGTRYIYSLRSYDLTGELHDYPQRIEITAGRPVAFQLLGAAPNPFNPATRVRFTLPEAARVTLSVFNTLGMQVATQTATLGGGTQAMSFDGSALASGTYLYRLTAQGTQTFVANGRFTLVR